jgi:hypothetical protein
MSLMKSFKGLRLLSLGLNLPAGFDGFEPQAQARLQCWFATQTTAQLVALAAQHDVLLVVCPEA